MELSALMGAMDAASQGITLADAHAPDLPLVYVNAAFERLTGYKSDDIVGKNCRFLQGPGTDPDQVCQIRMAIAAGASCAVELLNYRKDGTPFLNRLMISPLRNDAGQITHYVGIQTDISLLKHIEQELVAADSHFHWGSALVQLPDLNETDAKLQREAGFSSLLKAVSMAANRADDMDEALGHAVPSMCAHLGATEALLISTTRPMATQPTDASATPRRDTRWTLRVAQGAAEGLAHRLESQLRTHASTPHQTSDVWEWLLAHAARPLAHTPPPRNNHGPHSNSPPSTPDTALSDALRAAGIGTCVVVPIHTRHGTLKACVLLLLAQPSPTLADDTRLMEVLEAVAAQLGHVWEREGAQAEKLVLERRLLNAHKMEALGSFTSGISHDFNNLLTPILTLAELNMTRYGDDARLRRDFETILRASQRGKDLVRRLLHFSREDTAEFAPLNLRQLCEETGQLLRSIVPARIQLRLDLQPKAMWVHGNGTQLQQILLNLCSNSVAAMPAEGRLQVQLHQEAGPEWVYVEVIDTGCGIPDAHLHRIFDPFFTTKAVDQGTGLGLSVAYGIVEAHRGSIHVASEVNVGTSFTIRLPTVTAPNPS